MSLLEVPLTANGVLRTFHRDAPYLFLGAAFSTVALLAAASCVVRRRFEPLLVWFSAFALLYGLRLWLHAGMVDLSIPNSTFFDRLLAALDYLVPIPAFLFYRAAGFLGRRSTWVGAGLIAPFVGLIFAACVWGESRALHRTNDILVIVATLFVLFLLFRRREADHEFRVVRFGLVSFGIFSLFQNSNPRYNFEPYGFVILLSCIGYVAAHRSRTREEELGEIRSELELARRIQVSLLPLSLPEAGSFRMAARYVPMTSVAGDFYDLLMDEPQRAGLLMADVSGHGVPAALIASMVKMAAIAQRAHVDHPSALLDGMNRTLCGNTQGQYVTAAFVYLDAAKKELRYAAAGHPAMLRLRDGEVTEIAENGLLLAVVDEADYSECTMELRPGDRLLLYTDGLTEARDASGQLFGDAGLMRAFQSTAQLSASEAAEAVIYAVQQWAPSQEDDLTLVVCDFVA